MVCVSKGRLASSLRKSPKKKGIHERLWGCGELLSIGDFVSILTLIECPSAESLASERDDRKR